MNIIADDFDWDDGNRTKCEKHGLSAEDIEAVLKSNPRIAPENIWERKTG
jgi:uncharacterized DUF497 family protein